MRLSSGLNLDKNKKMFHQVEIPSFSKSKTLHFPPICILHLSSPALHIPDSEDSGDVPAPISSLSLQMSWLDLLELVPELATDDSDSSCRSQSTMCEGTFTGSSGPGNRKQSNQLIFLSIAHCLVWACDENGLLIMRFSG